MAMDTLIDRQREETGRRAIADAIRSKGGTQDRLAFPEGFKTAVEAIDTALPMQEKTAATDKNGSVVLEPDPGKALSKATVHVAVPAPETQEKTVEFTANGTTEITPDVGKLLSKVLASVKVPGFDPAPFTEVELRTYRPANNTLRPSITKNPGAVSMFMMARIDSMRWTDIVSKGRETQATWFVKNVEWAKAHSNCYPGVNLDIYKLKETDTPKLSLLYQDYSYSPDSGRIKIEKMSSKSNYILVTCYGGITG